MDTWKFENDKLVFSAPPPKTANEIRAEFYNRNVNVSFIKYIKERYRDDYETSMTKLSSIGFPLSMKKRHDSIINDSRNLEFSSSNLDNVLIYVRRQRFTLNEIKLLLGSQDREYRLASTLVAEIAIRAIEFAFDVTDEYARNDINYHYVINKHNRHFYQCAFEIIKELDNYDLNYSYKKERYSNVKNRIKTDCTIKYKINDESGCLPAILFFFISSVSLLAFMTH